MKRILLCFLAMTDAKNTINKNDIIEKMFRSGAHFGFAKSRRHPTAKPYIFGAKNRVEIFDLEKTSEALDKAKEFVSGLGKDGKQILFVGGKAEARAAVKQAAESVGMPYVAGRWIGGTLTNFAMIRSRVDKMLDFIQKKEKGELNKYTKKERLIIDRKIDNLTFYFSGIVSLKEPPKAIFVIDPKREKNAVAEARKTGVPVVALAGTDCDLSEIDYPIPANDSSVSSIKFFLDEIAAAYREGKTTVK